MNWGSTFPFIWIQFPCLFKAVFELRQDMNGLISVELEGVDKEYVIGIVILVILVIISPIIVVLIR